MLLKTLRLFNFRQFIGHQTIQFATDAYSNVTVVMGENGSGKTTLAQAFTWCLYGDTDFEDKAVLNRIVERKMLPGQEATVRVELELIHAGTEYTMIREQVYKKDSAGKVKAQNALFNIAYKKGGQQEFVRQLEVEPLMKKILPKELSRYFFFDGERIGKMSNELKKGRSQEFAQAVRGLLGLSAFVVALEHLKPTSKYSVIGSYNESYDSTSDNRIAKYTSEIEKAQEEIDRIDRRLAEIDNEVEMAREKCDELNMKLGEFKDVEGLQKQKIHLLETISKKKQARASAVSNMLKEFNRSASSYFSRSLVQRSLEQLSKADKLDKGIPDMHARTIQFLIQRGVCVCGNKIEFNNDAYKQLIKALEFLPPESIGMSITHFVRESELKARSSADLFATITDHYSAIRGYETELEQLQADIQNIERQIDENKGAGEIQQAIRRYERIISDRISERDELNRKRGAMETIRDRAISERAELTLRDEKNKKIEIYKAYAQRMYDKLLKIYKEHEDETRGKLQQYVNEIFRSIYEGGMSINVDERYNIQVVLEDSGGYSNDIETSTAQSISVIFSFIAGIIKMARENSGERDNQDKLLESEPYPLVMDAPLSAFDRRRIKTVCDVLPQVAEQVIIFIKDTDGELAEEFMGTKVGKRYFFDKRSELETHLMPR
ncbi:MAG: AAA family ATPase [Alicyclobacillus sp.]|nr:AAA family ATPase [Alicyclobacillus sp.]